MHASVLGIPRHGKLNRGRFGYWLSDSRDTASGISLASAIPNPFVGFRRTPPPPSLPPLFVRTLFQPNNNFRPPFRPNNDFRPYKRSRARARAVSSSSFPPPPLVKMTNASSRPFSAPNMSFLVHRKTNSATRAQREERIGRDRIGEGKTKTGGKSYCSVLGGRGRTNEVGSCNNKRTRPRMGRTQLASVDSPRRRMDRTDAVLRPVERRRPGQPSGDSTADGDGTGVGTTRRTAHRPNSKLSPGDDPTSECERGVCLSMLSTGFLPSSATPCAVLLAVRRGDCLTTTNANDVLLLSVIVIGY